MSNKIKILAFLVVLWTVANPAQESGSSATEIDELASSIEELKKEYEERIGELEEQVIESSTNQNYPQTRTTAPSTPPQQVRGNVFNPAASVVFQGFLANFSEDSALSVPGYGFGHESERASDGFSLGHTEVVLSSNIDDKFFGNLTLGFESHSGEAAGLEVEEAYIQTLPGAGLPNGIRVKAGRALWTFGYLNELHTHADDFADRPLPNRAFLDSSYNDDGIELAAVLPTAVYSEVGFGVFRSDDIPFGGSSSGRDANSFFGRVGGDLGQNTAWRAGAYWLNGDVTGRGGHDDHGHAHGSEDAHEDEHDHGDDHGDDHHMHEEDHHDEFSEAFTEGLFTGTSNMSGFDFRMVVSSIFGSPDSELILQTEYMTRKDDGEFEIEHMVAVHHEEEEEHHHEDEEHHEGEEEHEEHEEHVYETVHESFDADVSSSGWYTQAILRFSKQWRMGFRYAKLDAPDEVELGFSPYAYGMMIDFTNSEFSRLRLQFNREAFDHDVQDSQVILQYVMSIGAHAAHPF